MKVTLPQVLIFCVILILPGLLIADWIDDDGHKMHFPQHPDVVGWDVNATAPVVVADDWTCSETGWVKDIHFWGSWRNGVEGQIIGFQLAIYSDIPADPPQIPYSRPGDLLWEAEIMEFIIATPVDPPGLQGWYDPAEGIIIPEDHMNYWQYNVFLPEAQWFFQEEGTVYWLQISAILADPAVTHWGVKSSFEHHLDDAVWGFLPQPDWIDLWEPPDFMQSLDLSFVITGGADETGACCFPGTSQLLSDCVVTTHDSCVNFYGGVYEGDGTVCQGVEACCLPDSTCVMADALCCEIELGGTAMGAGTSCSAPEACCLPDGSCTNLDPVCCLDVGGTPQGAGTSCSGQTIACCLPDGTCMDMDEICCDDLGGVISPFSAFCLGDSDGNGIDDACEVAEREACCLQDGSCLDVTPDSCLNFYGGTPQGAGTACVDYTVACCLPDGTCMDTDPLCCDDMGGFISPHSAICLGDGDGNGIDDACEEPQEDTCEYYKPPYEDYAPNGMPDFDQKQGNWIGPPFGTWTHDGPAALANCMWWFDSKFEPFPVDPRPFYPDPSAPAPNDNFGLLQSYGQWDDHDTNNVVPFINDLAGYINTNGGPFGGGTVIFDIQAGFEQWLIDHGLEDYFTIDIIPGPPWELIRDEVLRSQDVILLLGFYEQQQPDFCCRLGSHYVTVAGVCSTQAKICISDPFYDANEGEPPAGSAHGSTVHNDAFFVSGPHGTIHHDIYDVQPQMIPCPPSVAMVELPTYPVVFPDIANFFQLNEWEPMGCEYQQGAIRTLVDWAIVICPCETAIGNCNGDAVLDVSDAVYIINYAFAGGSSPLPYPIASGDANCDCTVDVSDAVYIINYAFGGGPAPCTCMEWLDICGPPLR